MNHAFYQELVIRILAITLLCTAQETNAQFIDITSTLGVNNVPTFSPHGQGVSFYDFNYDGWDDLTLSAGSAEPLFFVNNNGTLEPADFYIPNPFGGDISMMLWADFDNDSDADLFIAKFGGNLELWQNDGEFNFTDIAATAGLQTGNFNHVGAAFCDYNHDGFLDLYVTKFYHPNYWQGPNYAGKLYMNNGNGTFSDVTEAAGVYIPARPTFQPVFLDFDSDGWEDLFLIIDRIHWPNELYRNNGDGTFTRVTEETGFDFNICSMTGTVDDYDNDADLDIYITNNPPVGNVLMENHGDGTFTNVAEQAGVLINEVTWGAVWLDYDNDSWQDLLVSVTSPINTPVGNQFLVNHQGTTFTQENELIGISNDPSEAYVCARGDINNDGYFDFAFNTKPPYHSRLYQNNGGENNYLSVSLKGTLSNKDGIGSWIHCYASGQHFVRFTLCGENLIAQNSNKEIFGLGDFEIIDSLVIEWNRGTRDVYYNLSPNQHLHLIEGQSNIDGFEISVADGTSLLCSGDSIILNAGEYESYLWNTGHQGQYITASDTGTYSVTVINEFGATGTSLPFHIEAAPETEFVWHIDNVSCYGADDGSIFLEISTGTLESIQWDTGQSSTFIENLSPGYYTFEAIDIHSCFLSESNVVLTPDSLWGFSESFDVSCYGSNDGHVEVEALGGTPPYYFNYLGHNPVAMNAGDYAVQITDWNDCEALHHYSIGQPDSLYLNVFTTVAFEGGTATVEIIGGTPPYTIEWSNGETETWNINDIMAGEYYVSVSDANGCSALSAFTIDIVSSIGEMPHSNLKLFPNPFNQHIHMTGCTDQLLQFDVYNQTGKQVFYIDKPQCNQPIEMGNLSQGMYVVVLTEWSGEKSYHKLLKIHP